MEKKMQHLQMIQDVITRMASNSFMLKGWAVTLIAGIFALASKDTNKLYFIIVYIPVIAFWALDSYYLLQERLYRALYDKIRQTAETGIDFSMKANTTEFGSKTNSFWSCLKSKTEFWFYFPLTIACTVIIIITHI